MAQPPRPLDVHSALAILTPKSTDPNSLYQQIEAIRCKHDQPRQVRWPPHINIFFPFLPVKALDEKIIEKLEALIREFPPFIIEFNEICIFPNGKSHILWLKPCYRGDFQAIEEIHRKIRQEITELKENKTKGEKHRQDQTGDEKQYYEDFIPHLSLGRWASDRSEGARQALQAVWRPHRISVEEIHFLHREGENPFKVHRSFKLGGEMGKQTKPVGNQGENGLKERERENPSDSAENNEKTERKEEMKEKGED